MITNKYVIIEVRVIDTRTTIASTIIIEESNMVVNLVAEADIGTMAVQIATIDLVTLIIICTRSITTKDMTVIENEIDLVPI